MQLGSYIFKPKHGADLAIKVIQRFCNDFLHYEHEGIYIHWRTKAKVEANGTGKWRPLPDGFIEMCIEGDDFNLNAWTETCYEERRLDASDLTDSFFALLPQDFWYADDAGKAEYHFYERELCEIISALATDDSRVVTFGGGRSMWVKDKSMENSGYKTIDLLDYALTVPIVKENETNPQGRQLQLTL